MATVQFDIDGVLADFIRGFTRLAKNLGYCERISGTAEQRVWEQYGDVPAEHVGAVWRAVKASTTFWETLLPLVPRATWQRIGALELDHDVYFATSRVGRNVKRQTVYWLRDQGIKFPTVLVTSRKGDTAAALGAAYAIDDKAGNAIVAGYQKGVRSYILDAPYNRFDPGVVGSPVRRVCTVDEFIDDIEEGK